MSLLGVKQTLLSPLWFAGFARYDASVLGPRGGGGLMRNYRHTAKGLAVVAALSFLLIPTGGLAENNPVVGTWRLKSFVREIVGTGERYNQLGEHPQGFLGYSNDGRMYAILVAGDRIKPHEEAPTDEERVKLHKSMIAYAGTYTIDGGKVVHHVDISWNGARTGTDQVRFYKLEGDTLTIRTAPNKSPVDGREGVGILVWEKAK
jgi:Lipocalin-like domain